MTYHHAVVEQSGKRCSVRGRSSTVPSTAHIGVSPAGETLCLLGGFVQGHEAKWLRACQMLAPIFSTCSRRQYFAVVVGTDKRIAGLGYNGSPAGMPHCVDGGCPRGRSNVPHGSTYSSEDGFCIAQHAEAGALLHSDPVRRRGGTVIVNGPPCFECARLIASSGVARVVCAPDVSYEGWAKVEEFLRAAGVEVEVVDV